MKTNTKGFTLIELLAVIVILAVIALIASPIVLGIINNSRKSAQARSVEAFAQAAQQAFATAMSTPGYMGEEIEIVVEKPAEGTTGSAKTYARSKTQGSDGKYTIEEEVKYSGSTVECGKVYYDADTGYLGLDECKVQGSTTTYRYCNAGKEESCKLGSEQGAATIKSTAGGAAENKDNADK